MEMDLGSAIIGTIAIVICTMPLILMNRSRKKRDKIFLKSLSELASLNNCRINQHEILGSLAIGIDETKNFVFFYRQTKDDTIGQTVDLRNTRSCKVIKTCSTFKNKNGNQKVIDRLELSFIPTGRNEPEIKMEFFNTDISLQLNDELQSIEKWSKLINDRLKHKK